MRIELAALLWLWPYGLALAILPWALYDLHRTRDIQGDAEIWARDMRESAQDRAWRDAEAEASESPALASVDRE